MFIGMHSIKSSQKSEIPYVPFSRSIFEIPSPRNVLNILLFLDSVLNQVPWDGVQTPFHRNTCSFLKSVLSCYATPYKNKTQNYVHPKAKVSPSWSYRSHHTKLMNQNNHWDHHKIIHCRIHVAWRWHCYTGIGMHATLHTSNADNICRQLCYGQLCRASNAALQHQSYNSAMCHQILTINVWWSDEKLDWGWMMTYMVRSKDKHFAGIKVGRKWGGLRIRRKVTYFLLLSWGQASCSTRGQSWEALNSSQQKKLGDQAIADKCDEEEAQMQRKNCEEELKFELSIVL